ncbi:hypothetical protein H4R24_002471 [Coemansia sp. RSA 988]|nr:hypothetical protein H4R24_002471 [Coemansia sp. RSA 988]
MTTFSRRIACGLLLGCPGLGVLGRSLMPEDLVQTNRFSGPVALSPDGADIAYVKTQYSIETKQQSTQLVIQSLGEHHHTVVITDHSADARPNPPRTSATEGDVEIEVDADIGKRRHLKASQPVWLDKDTLGFVTTDQTTHESTLYSVHGSGIHIAELDLENQERADSAQAYDELWVCH